MAYNKVENEDINRFNVVAEAINEIADAVILDPEICHIDAQTRAVSKLGNLEYYVDVSLKEAHYDSAALLNLAKQRTVLSLREAIAMLEGTVAKLESERSATTEQAIDKPVQGL